MTLFSKGLATWDNRKSMSLSSIHESQAYFEICSIVGRLAQHFEYPDIAGIYVAFAPV